MLLERGCFYFFLLFFFRLSSLSGFHFMLMDQRKYIHFDGNEEKYVKNKWCADIASECCLWRTMVKCETRKNQSRMHTVKMEKKDDIFNRHHKKNDGQRTHVFYNKFETKQKSTACGEVCASLEKKREYYISYQRECADACNGREKELMVASICFERWQRRRNPIIKSVKKKTTKQIENWQ